MTCSRRPRATRGNRPRSRSRACCWRFSASTLRVRRRARAVHTWVPRPHVHLMMCVRTRAGIDFVEWNAGSRLDEHMQPEGFRVAVRLDPATGLLYGGSAFNCGTWMDKMVRTTGGGRHVPRTAAVLSPRGCACVRAGRERDISHKGRARNAA